MFIPPNWVGMAAVVLLALGLRQPGILALGAGLELGYLFALVSNGRFQRWVDAEGRVERSQHSSAKLRAMLRELETEDQRRYAMLEQRCKRILDQQSKRADGAGLEMQSQGLGRLMWIYLRLLATRQALVRVLKEANSIDEPINQRLGRLEKKLRDAQIGPDLRRSYEGQMEILRQRVEKQQEARQKLDFLEAELVRIEQQIELIREQAVVSSDPNTLSQRIDEVGATLGSTNQWIHDQQRLYGSVEDLLDEPPAISAPSQRGGERLSE